MKLIILPFSNLVDEIESIPKITARRKEVLDPSPVLEMSQPVKSILSNMRVQRMSLCQSLRQYLFVYRGKSAVYILRSVLTLPSSHHHRISRHAR